MQHLFYLRLDRSAGLTDLHVCLACLLDLDRSNQEFLRTHKWNGLNEQRVCMSTMLQFSGSSPRDCHSFLSCRRIGFFTLQSRWNLGWWSNNNLSGEHLTWMSNLKLLFSFHNCHELQKAFWELVDRYLFANCRVRPVFMHVQSFYE